jgi:hypothetical protein
MSKKKDKREKKKAKKTANGGFFASRASGNAANVSNAAPGWLGDLGQWLRAHPSEQFLLGAAVGAAAAYVLGNEELRARVLKGGVALYASLAGGLAELREQVADLKAEIDAGDAGDVEESPVGDDLA